MVAAFKTLVYCGLPFRGAAEKIGLKSNVNFLLLLELLSEFYPFMNKHIKNYINESNSSTSYLLKMINEELIELMAKK